MRIRSIALVIALVVLACACATAPARAPETSMPVRPTAHSSIGAVLEHRAELALTDAQVARLSALEEQLRQKDQALRADPIPPPPAQDGMGDRSSTSEMGSPMGGIGGMRGGHLIGRHRKSGQAGSAPSLRDQFDQNDTEAYLEAEKILTDAQKGPARELASKYRAQLSDWRNAMKARSGSGSPAR